MPPSTRRRTSNAISGWYLPTLQVLERRGLPAATLPAFLSAAGFGVTGRESTVRANAVAIDAVGNTVLTGSFRGTITFATSGVGSTFTSKNTQDAFVASYSPAGAFNWARTFAGGTTITDGVITTAVGQGSALAVDPAGNIFLAGSFAGTVNFGSDATPQVVSTPRNTESFVARLGTAGDLAWVRVATAAGGDNQANALAADGQGGVIVAGAFAQAAGFGSAAVTSAASTDLYVARYTGAGSVAWATASQGTAGSNAQALGVAVDAAGSVAVTGFYTGTVSLGPGAGPSTAAGSFDAFAAKLGANGQLSWARTFGSPDYDAGGAVTFDSLGNVVVAGTFSGTVDFGTEGRADVLTAGPVFDAFVLKLDPGGSETWVRGTRASTGWVKGQALAVDSTGQVHVAGALSGTADFDPGPGLVARNSVGSTDLFALGLDSSGGFVYATRAGQTNFNSALGVAVDAAGAVALVGTYSGSIAFGALAVPVNGVASAFVARLQTRPTPTPAAPVLDLGSLTGVNNTTSVVTPAFRVAAAEVGNVVQLVRDGTVVAQRTGPGLLRDPGPVPPGVHSYTAIQISPANVASAMSPATMVTVLTIPPAAPMGLGLLAADDSGTVGDGMTRISAPRIAGRAGAGLTVQLVTTAGVALASGTAASDGSFAIRLPTLTDSTIAIRAVAVDAAANRSVATAPFNLSIITGTAAPAVPVLVPADDSGTTGDSMTNVRSPRFTVIAPAAAAVALIDASNAVVGTAGMAIGGVFTVAVDAGLPDGTYTFRAVATDPAGNVSAPGRTVTLTISGALPARLGAPSLLAADDSGVVNDALTAVRRPRITGTAAPGARVDWITPRGAVLASTVASATGSYILQAPAAVANGPISVMVGQVNSLGNASPTSPVLALTIRATTGDYFGQSTTNVAVFRPSSNTFFIWNPAWPGLYARPFADTGDVPISGDFFGDGTGDVAVFRPTTQTFYILDPLTSAYSAQQWGTTSDVPVPMDYDGDGRTDVAVFRPSTATFFIRASGSNTVLTKQWGVAGDIPVSGDYFGIGRAAVAVFRPSNATFYVCDLTTGTTDQRAWGGIGDIPVPGDYDGDGRTDPAVFNPITSTFYAYLATTNRAAVQQWGVAGDIPVAGDYFGGGRSSWAIYRPSNQTFYASDPTTGRYLAFPWGVAGDQPIQPPLATKSNLGGGSGRALAISTRRSGGAALVGLATGPMPTAFVIPVAAIGGMSVTSTPALSQGGKPFRATRGSVLDRAIADLSLERWRTA